MAIGAGKGGRTVMAVRVLAFTCVALALMCAGLAYAWKVQRDQADCWRAAAQFQLEGACEGS
jgi:hypothetical protein